MMPMQTNSIANLQAQLNKALAQRHEAIYQRNQLHQELSVVINRTNRTIICRNQTERDHEYWLNERDENGDTIFWNDDSIETALELAEIQRKDAIYSQEIDRCIADIKKYDHNITKDTAILRDIENQIKRKENTLNELNLNITELNNRLNPPTRVGYWVNQPDYTDSDDECDVTYGDDPEVTIDNNIAPVKKDELRTTVIRKPRNSIESDITTQESISGTNNTENFTNSGSEGSSQDSINFNFAQSSPSSWQHSDQNMPEEIATENISSQLLSNQIGSQSLINKENSPISNESNDSLQYSVSSIELGTLSHTLRTETTATQVDPTQIDATQIDLHNQTDKENSNSSISHKRSGELEKGLSPERKKLGRPLGAMSNNSNMFFRTMKFGKSNSSSDKENISIINERSIFSSDTNTEDATPATLLDSGNSQISTQIDMSNF